MSERGSRYIDFVLPGLLAMNLMGGGIWGLGFGIVDARRKKLLKRFIATPMSKAQYLFSYLVMRLVMMVVEVLVVVTFGVLVFGVPMRGSLGAFALVCVVGTLMFGAIGLLIASRARTLEGASGLMNVVMLPMWVASGVFFAATNFPNAVQPVVQALPLTAVVDAMRMNMLQGSGVAAMAGELGIMARLAGALLRAGAPALQVEMTDAPRSRVALAFVSVYLLWGSTYLFIKYAVASTPTVRNGRRAFPPCRPDSLRLVALAWRPSADAGAVARRGDRGIDAHGLQRGRRVVGAPHPFGDRLVARGDHPVLDGALRVDAAPGPPAERRRCGRAAGRIVRCRDPRRDRAT